ncbi:MAG: DUF4837 family protein [Candidatus Eiseniibacteriota bacterium]|nr:MAG: DUF4837 family protein [Candidatus Eisenbacteria bacterium]
MRNLILASLACLFVLSIGGCSPRQLPALGPANQLTIVTNVRFEDESVGLLQATFAKDVVTVDEEKAYAFELLSPRELTKHRNSRNLLLLADLSREDSVTRKIRRLLGKSEFDRLSEGAGGYVVLRNAEALGQTLVIVAGPDSKSLAKIVRTKGEQLFAEVDSMVIERTVDVLYLHGEQDALSRYLSSKYGWTVRIPKGFRVAEDEPGRLVKLVADEPARLLFVHWGPAEKTALDARDCLELRSRLVWAYYDEDVIERSMTHTRETVFQGRKAVRIQGVWQNEKHVIGGPFFTFCFHEKGRFYMIDCVVFAPGMDKASFLKQLEALASTFRDERKSS